MRTLCLEASGPLGSVAWIEQDALVEQTCFEIPRGRGSAMFCQLDALVRRHGPADRVIVGVGPGSYNALRSSIATAWGLASAWDVPLHGVPSVLGYSDPHYQVVGDARAGQIFVAIVRDGRLAAPPALHPASEAASLLDPALPIWTSSVIEEIPLAVVRAPEARYFPRHASDFVAPEPIYLKPAHITQPRI